MCMLRTCYEAAMRMLHTSYMDLLCSCYAHDSYVNVADLAFRVRVLVPYCATAAPSVHLSACLFC